MRNLIFMLLVFALGFTSCEDSNNMSNTYQVDNPTDVVLNVQIGGESYVIPAHSSKHIMVPVGRTTLVCNGDSVAILVKKCSEPTILNPTLSNYILYTLFYTDPNSPEVAEMVMGQIKSNYMHRFELDEGTVVVPFKVINSLFIDRHAHYWHYEINEPYPEDLSFNMGRNSNTSYGVVARSKMFRETDFYAYAKKDMPDFESFFKFSKNTTKLSELEPYDLFEGIGDCPECPAGAKKLKEIRQLWNLFLACNLDNYAERYLGLSRVMSDKVDSASSDEACGGDYLAHRVEIGKRFEKLAKKGGFVVK